ncbi:uncharacterized protein LOC121932905 [Sceloporus undulatus]|uniref:uncharacterized protein LOC121932905 n=1 Tax=Sceloporus undulatus TaxID=8520 RepID=UPI001C4C5CA2|nr:uncharacterized protein LOC121932905 [Sceloporus undulatus]
MVVGTRKTGAKSTPNSTANTLRRPSVDTPTKSSEPDEKMMEEIRKMHQETNQAIEKSKEDLKVEFKRDLRHELGEVTSRLDKIDTDLKQMNGKVEKLETDMRKMEIKVETMHRDQQEDQDSILRLQLKQRENCLKLRGLPENVNENLYTLLTPILAKFIGESETLFPWEIDRAYRINSRIAKIRKLPRDVVIYFVRKQTKEIILRQSYTTKLIIEDKEITVLRDIPGKILKRRKEYSFLIEQLRARKILYKWDDLEGVIVNWKQKKVRLNSTEKARLFLKGLKEGSDGGRGEEVNKGKPEEGGGEEEEEGEEDLIEE